MTDGQENSSKEYTAPKIADMIKHQRETYNWQFIFLGANQDAILTGQRLNISTANSATFVAAAGGTTSSLRSTSANIGKYRIGGIMDTDVLNYTSEQRKEMKEEDDGGKQ